MSVLFTELLARYDDAVGDVERIVTKWAVTRDKATRHEADKELGVAQERANRLRRGILEAYDVQAKVAARRQPDLDIAIGEDAFKAGFTPPEDLCGGGS